MFFSLTISILILNRSFHVHLIYKCSIEVKVDVFRIVNIFFP